MPAALGGLGGLIGPLLGTGTAATVGKIALAAGAIALQIFLTPRQKVPKPDDLRTTRKSEEGPGRWAIGRVEVEGQVLFGNTDGYNLYRVILHAFGPLDAVEEYFYDGRPVVVEASDGQVSSPPYVSVSIGSHLRLNTKVGDGSETAWPDLVTRFSQYTTSHRVRGIAQTKLRMINPGTQDEKFGRMLQGGLKPVRLRARFGLFDFPWDPRLAGGSGARAWTVNAVLIAAHIRTLLPGTAFADLDWDDIADRADEAEETVATLTGTAPRAILSGGGEGPITTDVMLDFLLSAGLEEVRAPDGKVRLAWTDDYPDAELHLEARHIVAVTVQRGPEGVKRPNVCRVKYLSPERQYTVAELPIQTFGGDAGAYDGPAWARVQDEVDLYGEQEMTVELAYCPDASQAQRLARRLFHMERADVAEVVTTFAGVAAWGARTIDVDIPDVGADGAALTRRARVESWAMDDAAGQCRLILRLIPSILQTAWDPSTDEVAPPPEFTAPEYESELDKPAAPTTVVDVELPDGTRQMRTSFAGVTSATVAEANYRTYTGGEPDLWQGMTESGLTFAYVAGDFRGERVDVRVRMFDAEENGSYFSDLLDEDSVATDATAPGAPTGLEYTLDDSGSGEVISFAATAPDDISVVKLELRQGVSLSASSLIETFTVIPGQSVETTAPTLGSPDPGDTEGYWAVPYATGDVAGTAASITYTRTGGGA